MAANLKGNLGLKSSPLAPTACKLSTQYLVLDHMTNHYNKIAKAKSAIDNKPPRSIASSQKIRDRKNRSRLMTTPSYSNGQKYEDIYDDFDPEDDEERLVQSIMKSTLGKTNQGSHDATFGSSSKQHTDSLNQEGQMSRGTFAVPRRSSRPLSARSTRSMNSLASGSVTSLSFGNNTRTHDPVKVTYDGDLLEKRSHCFTDPDRPFTPRTLKTQHESRLKSSKSYNAPRPKSMRQNVSTVKKEDENQKPQPQPQPRRRLKPGSSSHNELGETMPTNEMSESMLMDITLQSRDGQRWQKSPGDVPPLAISMDPDHMNWIQEQASKAQVRARSSNKIRSSMPMADQTSREGSQDGHQGLSNGQDLSSSVRLETLKKEQEQKYLAFAKEVTDDVLARGICTDKVLHRLFESHIEKRKGTLEVGRMREVLADIKKDLGLRDSSPAGDRRSEVKFSHQRSSAEIMRDAISTPEKTTPEEPTTNSVDTVSHKSATDLDRNSSASAHSFSATMESTSTMQFGQTGDMYSTVHSDRNGDADMSTLTKEDSNRLLDTADQSELTSTQVIKQYQMDLTAKDQANNGDVSGSETAPEGDGDPRDRPATGERRFSTDDSTKWTDTRRSEWSTENDSTNRKFSRVDGSDKAALVTNGNESANTTISQSSGNTESMSQISTGPKTRPRAKRREKINGSASNNPLSPSDAEGRHGLGYEASDYDSTADQSSRTIQSGMKTSTTAETNDRDDSGSRRGSNGEAYKQESLEDDADNDGYADDYEEEASHRTSDEDF